MDNYTPFDYEKMLLGHLLIYGSEAARYVLPNLTLDKFVYSKEGLLGGLDHQRIWQAMTLCYLQEKTEPTTANVMLGFNGNGGYHSYLTSLETQLAGYYRIREFNPRTVMHLAETVDKAGIMYTNALVSKEIGDILLSSDTFARAVAQTEDVDIWLSDYVHRITDTLRPIAKGYQHISQTVGATRDLIARVKAGEQLFLLDCGLPSLYRIGVPRTGRLMVLHGMSNSGKSTLLLQMLLGAAMGLVKHNIKGCVALNSFEEDQDSLNLSLAGILAGMNTYRFTMYGEITPDEERRLDIALDYLSTLPIYPDYTNPMTSTAIDFAASGLHSGPYGPVHMIGVDYLELVKMAREHSDNKEQILDDAIHTFFQVARRTGANVTILSQSTYSQGGASKFKIAGPEGTRWSRSIQHASDDILEIWNPVEMAKSGIVFEVPPKLNKEQPWLLKEKGRSAPKADPLPLGWEAPYRRFWDPALNPPHGPAQIVLYDNMPDLFSTAGGF